MIRTVEQGGTYRTIHPLLQAQGFTGSANAVYPCILKLRQEIPEALRPVPLESPADLQLQQISRDTVYEHVLKHAADSLPKAGEVAPHTASSPQYATGLTV